jgi:uncharacterized protein (TIGR02453 family)
MNNLPLDFLENLKKNNNRDWFAENKPQYEEAKNGFENFVSQLIDETSIFDKKIIGIEAKKTIFRIYRDVRFSKNKTPYKTSFGSYISAGGRKSVFAGYYLHIEPDASFLAGGMHLPSTENLKKLRQEILYNVDEFKSILNDKNFKNNFESLKGEKLKRPPKGFPADFKEIELLKNKEFIVIHSIKNEDILGNEFLNYVSSIFKTMKPLNDFLNRALD